MIENSVGCTELFRTGHAVERMLARGITMAQAEYVLATGTAISSYPDSRPFPCFLLLGFPRGEPLHIVVGKNPDSLVCSLITAYYPAPSIWEADWKTRKSA